MRRRRSRRSGATRLRRMTDKRARDLKPGDALKSGDEWELITAVTPTRDPMTGKSWIMIAFANREPLSLIPDAPVATRS